MVLGAHVSVIREYDGKNITSRFKDALLLSGFAADGCQENAACLTLHLC